MPQIELDCMEYDTDGEAQAAWVASDAAVAVATEKSIVYQGGASLKITAAQTSSLDKTVTRAIDVAATSLQDTLSFAIRPSRNGANIKFEAFSNALNVVPQMTSDNTPSGVASASSCFSNRYAWRAFDRSNVNPDLDNWVGSSGAPQWLQYQFASAKVIGGYSIAARPSSASPIGAPQAWTFLGSNDGTNWTTLDTRTNQINWAGLEKRTYTFDNSTAYTYYRLNVTTGTWSYIVIGEMEIMEMFRSSFTPSLQANVWQVIRCAWLGIPSVEELQITIVNADAENVLYIDDMCLTGGVATENYLALQRGRSRFQTMAS